MATLSARATRISADRGKEKGIETHPPFVIGHRLQDCVLLFYSRHPQQTSSVTTKDEYQTPENPDDIDDSMTWKSRACASPTRTSTAVFDVAIGQASRCLQATSTSITNGTTRDIGMSTQHCYYAVCLSSCVRSRHGHNIGVINTHAAWKGATGCVYLDGSENYYVRATVACISPSVL